MDSSRDNLTIDINPIDSNKKYEDIFFLESNYSSELNISINEESFIPFQFSDSLSKTQVTTNNNSNNLNNLSRTNSNTNFSTIDLRRKKNREASKVSRQKKKEDIICLVKTNQVLKKKIKELLENNICAQCKKKISLQSLSKPINNDINNDISFKPHQITSSISVGSSSSLNPSSRAKTAMFISVVVIFCFMVNSFSDRSKNYLRMVSLDNYYNNNDYINFLELNMKDQNDISQCLDLLKYHYSINKPGTNANNNNKRNQIEIVHDTSHTAAAELKCKKIIISQDNDINYADNSDNKNSIISNNQSIRLKIAANREYLVSKLFEEETLLQQDKSKPYNLQLDCVDIYLN